MGRSVATHPDAVDTFYLTLPANTGESEEDFGHDDHAMDDFIEDLRQVVDGTSRGGGFPSLRDCDRRAGRETKVILENNHCEIGVSQYGNLVAVCLAPINDTPLSVAWTRKMSGKFRRELLAAYPDNALQSHGSMSNGQQVFSKPDRPLSECCVTSGEGRIF